MLNAVPIFVTLASQVPLQRRLDRGGFSVRAISRLIRMEWLRSVPHLLNAALFLWIMAQALGVPGRGVPS
ncbi:MAG: hypothetical protein ACREDM_11415 [Methylocella sp.]